MLRILLFCLLGQPLPALLIYMEDRKRMRAALLLKALSSLYFVLLGFFLMKRCPDPRYARYIFAGLLFGLGGDVLLNLCHLIKENRLVFLAGGTLFLTGHILYLLALLPAAGSLLRVFLYTLLLFLPLVLFVYWRTAEETVLRILALIYLLAVTLMTASALSFFHEAPALYRARLIFPGALLFLLSDTLLVKNMLNQNRFRWMRIVLLVFYYLGQTLIALSLGSS